MRKQLTLTELEERLGPADEFVPDQRSRQYLAQWALAIGTPPPQVYAMSLIQLGNLYHERGNQIKTDASELQRIGADILLNVLNAVQHTKVDPAFMRAMIVDEIEKLPARKVEIVLPSHSYTLPPLHHYLTETVIRVAAMNHPIMMVGPAGCGKTTIANHTATALGLPFYITSTITDEHHLTGFVDGRGFYHTTPFRRAFEHGGVWAADELDAWDAAALLAANSALANGYSVFPDNPQPVMRHPDFRMIGTANTFGHGADRVYIGRNELDAASLDRFATIPVDYDLTMERTFCNGNIEWLDYVWNIRKQVDKLKIRHVVSSRAIIFGSLALQCGLTRDDVEAFYLFKGMSERDKSKLNAREDDE